MSDYSSQYASLVNSQNNILGNLAQQNQAELLDSSNKILQDAKDKQDRIDKLHQSEQLGLLPEAIKDSDYTDTAVFGLKSVLDIGDNLKSVGKAKREALEGRSGVRITPLIEGEDSDAPVLSSSRSIPLNQSFSALDDPPLTSDPFVRAFAGVEPAPTVRPGFGDLGTDAQGFTTKLYRTARDSKVGQKIAQYGSDVVQGAKDIKTGLSSAENIGEALVKEVSDPVSIAGKALAKLAPVADIASGGLNVGEDIDGLIKGESLKQAMGDNSEERWSNALGIAGSALTFIPGADLVGGLFDITSGVLDFFGEKQEAAAKDDEAQHKIDEIKAEKSPSLSVPISTPGMASLGMISNYSKPQNTLIQGSGAF